MSCGFDKEKLTGYFDGELEAAGKAEVERHIGACSECLRELGEIKFAAQLVKGLPRLRAPRSIAEGVSREIMASGGTVASFDRSRRRLGWLTAAAAAAFVAVNISYFAGLSGRPGEAPRTAAPVIGSTELAKETPEARRLQRRGAETADKADEAEGKPAAGAERKTVLKDAAPAASETKKDNRALAEKSEKAKELEAPKPEPAKVPAAPKEEDRAAKPAPKPAAPPAPAPAATPAPAPEAPGAAAPVLRGELAGKQAPVPEILTLASTKLADSRAKFEEIFKKYGADLPEANSKLRTASPGGLRSVSLSLTPERLEALKLELEKVGHARLLTVAPEDPSLAKLQQESAGKKPASVATGGTPRSKDSLGFGTKAGARESGKAGVRESGKADNGQIVVIHLLEVSELPPAAVPPAAPEK